MDIYRTKPLRWPRSSGLPSVIAIREFPASGLGLHYDLDLLCL